MHKAIGGSGWTFSLPRGKISNCCTAPLYDLRVTVAHLRHASPHRVGPPPLPRSLLCCRASFVHVHIWRPALAALIGTEPWVRRLTGETLCSAHANLVYPKQFGAARHTSLQVAGVCSEWRRGRSPRHYRGRRLRFHRPCHCSHLGCFALPLEEALRLRCALRCAHRVASGDGAAGVRLDIFVWSSF